MKDILKYAILINIPLYTVLIFFYSKLFDFSSKMPFKKIIIYSILFSLLDGISKYTVPSDIHPFVSVLCAIILLYIVFRFNIVTAIGSYLIITLLELIIQLALYFPFASVTGITSKMFEDSLYNQAIFTYCLVIIILAITFIIYKTKFAFKFFRKFELFVNTKIETFMTENIKHILQLFFLLFVVNASSFSMWWIEKVNKTNLEPNYWLVTMIISSAAFSYIVYRLYKELVKYQNYKTLYEIAKKQLEK